MKNLKIKVISKYLRPYKKEFLYGALALLLVNILSVVIPLEVKNIIDQLQNGFSSDFVISKSLWLIFLATCMGLIRLFSRQIVFGIGRKVEVNLRQKLFDHLLIQDPEWIQKKGSGDIISRATSDVENIRRLLGFTVLSLCNIVLAYSFTIPSMFSINKTLTISALMIFPLILGIVSLFGGRMVKQRKAQQESLSKLSDLIQEDLSGISAIKIYAQENAEKKEFNIHNNDYRNSAIKLARTASTLFPLLQGISSISLLILLSLGTFQLESGFISIGGLVALILYVERLVFPTALLGPVGCGKTTLAKSLGRTIEIPDNQLFLDEIDVKTLKLSDLRKNISIVPQEAFLFTSTISENLSFGEPKASKYLVKESATKAGLIDDINSFPQRFKTIVGERGITLSGGQRQRTALGRALLVNSPIVVLDDALASVDNKTAARIIDEMSDRSNKTIIMISHQLSVAATCDRVLVMDKGEIVQEGNHKDLVKVNGLYKQLWDRELATRIVKS